MFNTKIFTRSMAMAGGVTLLLGSTAFAQNRPYHQPSGQVTNQESSNRLVEGTVASVVHDRNGDRVRLTSGMDLMVPNTVIGVNQGHRYGASTLQPGDVVRMNVYSSQGDGRNAEARSLELVQTNSAYNNNDRRYNNEQRLNGTVVSYNRRAHSLVMQDENGRTVNVDVTGNTGRSTSFHRGDRISITGHTNRGVVIADNVRLSNNRR